MNLQPSARARKPLLALALAAFLGAGAQALHAQINDTVLAAEPPTSAEPPVAPPATAASDPQRWAFVPILMSNAETGVQVGALVMRFLNPGDTANKPSSLGFAVRASQKGQAQVNLFPEWYLGGNLYHVTGELNYIRWPADFYGIGNGTDIPKDSADSYLAQGVNGNLTGEREWFRNFSAGPMALFSYEDIEVRGKQGLLAATVPGQSGGLVTGLGALMTYDGRDAIYWARSGFYARAKAAWYRGAWGSDFDFDSYCLEARQFVPLFATGALGISATLQLKDGEVPFRELSTADGDHNLRGIVRGKYRDNHLLTLQSEYKSYFPDWGFLGHKWVRNRLGWAVFGETGQVAHATDDFAWEEFRPDFGFGLRYAMNPSQRMNIRVDIGFVDGSVAPAINIKEAF